MNSWFRRGTSAPEPDRPRTEQARGFPFTTGGVAPPEPTVGPTTQAEASPAVSPEIAAHDPVARPEPELQPQPEAHAEPEPEPQPEAHAEPEPEPQPETHDGQHHGPPSEEQSGSWLAWCASIGEVVLPIMLDLHRRIPQTTAAMLCTADGFNLCALGLEEGQVGRLAALSSSLYAVGNASAVDTERSGGEKLDYLTLVSRDNLKVLTSIPHATLGRVLLWASADSVSLGVLLVGVRGAADQIRRALALADQPPTT